MAALDDDLLALWLDAGDGEELVLERLAGRGGVDVDLVLLALVLYDYYRQARRESVYNAVVGQKLMEA